jgi:hypothetical protein
MKIEFYPTLAKAVESLKRGEGLYTDSRFLLDPVRIVYKREGKSAYKATGLDHGEITWNIGGGNKIVVSSHREKDGRKYVHAELLKGEELVRIRNTENLYKCLILKTEELGELLEGLTSLVENNRNMFKKPMRDVVSLGLKKVNIKNKDFVLIEDLYWETKSLGIEEFFRKHILESARDEDWKKRIGSYSLYLGDRAEKELQKILSNLTKEVETNIDWRNVLVVVDRTPSSEKAKVMTELWEDGRVLGIEIGGDQELIQELQDHFNKYGKWSLEKSFPNILGKICMSTSNLPKREKAEFVLVCLGVEEKEGILKVDYLALVKLSIEDRKFLWLSSKPFYSGNEVNIRISYENSIRMVNRDKIPGIEILGEGKRENKAVIVKANLVEEVEISPHLPISVEEVEYRAIRKGFSREIYIGENPEIVEGLKEIEDGKTTSELASIKVLLKGYLNPRIRAERSSEGSGCLGRYADELIVEEMGIIASEIEKHEKDKGGNERKGILKAAKLVTERISEILEKKKAVKSKCYHVGVAREPLYQYDVYSTYPEKEEVISAKGHKPVVEEGEFLEILRRHLTTKILRNAEKAASFLKQEKELELCFSHGKEKVSVIMDSLKEISKTREKLILRNISRSALGEFLSYEYSGKIVEEDGNPLESKEIKEVDKLALGLSGSIVSSIIYPWRNFVTIFSNINEITEEIYTTVFKTVTGGSFINRREGERMDWVKIVEPMINGKALLQAATGILIEVEIRERIILRLVKPEPLLSLYTEANKLATELTFFLDTGIKNMVAEIKTKTRR